MENPRRDVSRIVLPPAAYVQEKEKLEAALAGRRPFIKERKLNERFGPEDGDVGVILQGGMYNTVMRALHYLGLADIYGETRVPLYVMNVTYPVIDDEVVDFCLGKRPCSWSRRASPSISSRRSTRSCVAATSTPG